MRYRCKVGFSVDRYDDDGRDMEEYEDIEVGSVFERSEDSFRIAGGPDTIHLVNGIQWLEITQEHLDEFFEPVEEGREDA